MKLSSAIKGGLAGASTISLLGETLQKMNGHSSQPNGIKGKSLRKRFKKVKSRKSGKATKQFIGLAGDLLGNASFLGLDKLTKKKNAVLGGALLGAAAGLGAVWLNDRDEEHSDGKDGYPFTKMPKDPVLEKVLQVALFTVGGMLAGKLVKETSKKKKKK